MEPMIIALICAASFGALVVLAVFIRQLILSRDRELNEEAQRRALAMESAELEKMREQMQSHKRFDSHHHILGENKDAIVYLDKKIEDILHKKMRLIDRYAKISLQESEAIVGGRGSDERKAACDRLRKEIDEQIEFYDNELKQLQRRRRSLWSTHTDLQEYLLNQEKSRNEHLDYIYKKHSSMLEKVYLRHIDNSEQIGIQTIQAGTTSFKDMIMAPLQFLWPSLNSSSSQSTDQATQENSSRDEVDRVEDDINDTEPADGDFEDTDKPTKDEPDDFDAEVFDDSEAERTRAYRPFV